MKLGKEIKIKVRNDECGSDAIDRYMKRKGYKKQTWRKADAVRIYYVNDNEALTVMGQYLTGDLENLKNLKVVFELGRNCFQ